MTIHVFVETTHVVAMLHGFIHVCGQIQDLVMHSKSSLGFWSHRESKLANSKYVVISFYNSLYYSVEIMMNSSLRD